jgi:hypothetical protein
VPGLVGVIVSIGLLMLGALILVRERGSRESLLAPPVDALDALIGELSPYVVIGAAQGAVVVGLAQPALRLAGEQRHLGIARCHAAIRGRQLALGLCFLGALGKPDAGEAGRRILLSSINATPWSRESRTRGITEDPRAASPGCRPEKAAPFFSTC